MNNSYECIFPPFTMILIVQQPCVREFPIKTKLKWQVGGCRQSEALSGYDMSEFSSWMDVIIDLTSRHFQRCADYRSWGSAKCCMLGSHIIHLHQMDAPVWPRWLLQLDICFAYVMCAIHNLFIHYYYLPHRSQDIIGLCEELFGSAWGVW